MAHLALNFAKIVPNLDDFHLNMVEMAHQSPRHFVPQNEFLVLSMAKGRLSAGTERQSTRRAEESTEACVACIGRD